MRILAIPLTRKKHLFFFGSSENYFFTIGEMKFQPRRLRRVMGDFLTFSHSISSRTRQMLSTTTPPTSSITSSITLSTRPGQAAEKETVIN